MTDKQTYKRGTYRASLLTPSEKIPFGARSVGHYIVQPGSFEKPAVKPFVQIFWGIRGSGALVIDGLERKLEPGKIAIYFPGMTHDIHALDTEWEYRWWTMDGPLAVSITTGFGLARSDIYEAGPAPVEIFEELEKAISENSNPAGERSASAVAFKLLALAAGSRRTESPQDVQVMESINIIHREWNNPLLGVEILAERVNMDRSVFSRRFQKAMAIAPVNYIINLRVQNALSQLKYSDENISKIARRCGWRDPNYFSRCIRKATGQSPEAFRES